MPFGGVGPSGCMFTVWFISSFGKEMLTNQFSLWLWLDGMHTGKYSFDMFTHQRTSMDSPGWCVYLSQTRNILWFAGPFFSLRVDYILNFRFPPYSVGNFLPLLSIPHWHCRLHAFKRTSNRPKTLTQRSVSWDLYPHAQLDPRLSRAHINGGAIGLFWL